MSSHQSDLDYTDLIDLAHGDPTTNLSTSEELLLGIRPNASISALSQASDVPAPQPQDKNTTSDDTTDVIEKSNIDDIFDSSLREPTTPKGKRTEASGLGSSIYPTPETPTTSTSSYAPAISQYYGFSGPTTPPKPDSPANPFAFESPRRSIFSMVGGSGPPSSSRSTNIGQSSTQEPAFLDQSTPYDEQLGEHWTQRERRIREREEADHARNTRRRPSWMTGPPPSVVPRRLPGVPFETFGPLTPPPPPPQPPSVRFDPTPSFSWRPREPPYGSNQRPDIQGRNAALTTISNIMFNFDILPDEAADLLQDACDTAREVGVSTQELLAQTVVFGNEDLGMTPLCLEASRWEVGAGTELLEWLIENTPSNLVARDLRKGCLMRNNGMGDQLAWSAMRLFVPEREDQAVFAYDVSVDNIGFVPNGAQLMANQAKESETTLVEHSDDEGSLYDEASLIDAASSIDQADIETLKSSDDEGDKKMEEKAEPLMGPNIRVHRARIEVPLFKETLTYEGHNPAYTAFPPSSTPSKLLGEIPYGLSSNRFRPMNKRVLTAEWVFEGRIWALAMGEDKLVLTLRHASDQVFGGPIKVKALIRVFPTDVRWDGFEELAALGPDRLLPTQEVTDILLIPPSYTCEFEEAQLVPGPATLRGTTSLCREGIYMSSLSLLDLVGAMGAMKVEVTIKTTEPTPQVPDPQPSGSSGKQKAVECDEKQGGSVSDEASEWQLVD